MQQKELNYEEKQSICDEYEFEEHYSFSPSITKKRTVNGKTYIVKSYFLGGKNFIKTVEDLAVKQAYRNINRS